MDEERSNPDRSLPEQPVFTAQQTHESSGSTSLGAMTSGGDATVAVNGDAIKSEAHPLGQPDPYAEQVNTVINSEIGVQTLLNRLKQSIASAKEFALFLKKRSTLEEEHANGLRKICRITHENLHRPEHRQGSFAQSYDEISRIHERIADNGIQFAASLHQMHEDLLEMTSNIERGRKHWKQAGLTAEQRLVDAETAMRKSKAKYDAIAEDYDRARTGDRQSGKKFGLKGPKSAAQHEEDLLRKVQVADGDYGSKVQIAQSTRAEHLTKVRPDAIRSIQDLIRECDSALTLQMQKFATFNEKLLLQNGISVSPIQGQTNEQGKEPRSLRDAVSAIDNGKDLSYFIASHASNLPPRPPEIKYERNPVLNPSIPTMPTPLVQRQSEPMQSFNTRQGPQPPFNGSPLHSSPIGAGLNQGPPPPVQHTIQQHERSFSQGPPIHSSPQTAGPIGRNGPNHTHNSSSISASGPPQLSTLPFQNSAPLPTSFSPVSNSIIAGSPPAKSNNPPPLKPVFGMTLEQLFDRDGSAVPMVVYQCIQAIDLYGLEMEGIYRLSGTTSHVNKIKGLFDNDASQVDFRNPENFFHDVNSVAGLLKQFFRELPDPLMTTEHYQGFIDAAKSDDDIVRRDSLHAIINSLPDPNYATLRALTLHLNRVQENSSTNRMNGSNLAIVFGPTLMGANTGSNIQDAGWQVRVIDTILGNTYQIFDED